MSARLLLQSAILQIIPCGMDQASIIADIEQRARRVGVPIGKLCARAGLNPTTFSRWKRTKRNPEPIGATLHSIGKLYTALSLFEAEDARSARRGKAVAA